MSEIYRTSMLAKGGRDGAVFSADEKLKWNLSIPKEMGGGGEAGTNPEELFAAGYSACFLGSVDLAARRKRILLPKDTTVQATVRLGVEDTGFAISVELNVVVPGLESETAQMLVDAAHTICPYSRALGKGAEVSISISS